MKDLRKSPKPICAKRDFSGELKRMPDIRLKSLDFSGFFSLLPFENSTERAVIMSKLLQYKGASL